MWSSIGAKRRLSHSAEDEVETKSACFQCSVQAGHVLPLRLPKKNAFTVRKGICLSVTAMATPNHFINWSRILKFYRCSCASVGTNSCVVMLCSKCFCMLQRSFNNNSECRYSINYFCLYRHIYLLTLLGIQLTKWMFTALNLYLPQWLWSKL